MEMEGVFSRVNIVEDNLDDMATFQNVWVRVFAIDQWVGGKFTRREGRV